MVWNVGIFIVEVEDVVVMEKETHTWLYQISRIISKTQ